MKLHHPRLLAAGLLAALLTWLVAWRPFSADTPTEKYFLELTAAAPLQGSYNVKIDEGHGVGFEVMRDFRSAADPKVLFVRLAPGRVRSLQVTAFSTPTLGVTRMRIFQESGETLLDLPRTLLKAGERTEIIERPEGTVFRAGENGAPKFEFSILPLDAFYIPSGNEPWWPEVLGLFLLLTAGAYAAIGWLEGERSASLRQRAASISAAAAARPLLTLTAVAIAAGLASSYPIVFCGKSLVSPNHYATLLHDQQPAVPGAPIEQQENPKGADLGAMMWQTQPYSALVSRTILHEHELPLFNRYSSGGISLLGQHLSMAADPLNLLTLWADGAPWSWDLRFVLARILFALGIGLCAWQVTRHLGVSALLAGSAAWIGYFAFRFNHPAIFSLSYAPWVLLPWLALARGASRRGAYLWALLLIAADWAELNSGTGKESSILLLSMNAGGFLALLLAPSTGEALTKVSRLAIFIGTSAIFALLSAPCWLLFLDALKQAFTIYSPKAYQLQPSLALGFFDELFTQDFSQWGNHTNPSLNFLVLAGVVWFFATGRSLFHNRSALALSIASVPVAAMVFGVVPPTIVVKLPIIGNIQHIHNTFGCVLMVWLLVLAAAGWRDCLEMVGSPEWSRTWRRLAVTLALLLIAYMGFTQAIPQPPYNLFTIKAPLHSRFFFRCAPLLLLAAATLPWAFRAWRERGGYRLAGAMAFALCLTIIHFRHGMYVATKFDDFVLNPKTRVTLDPQSAALDRIRAEMREPARVAGFGDTFFPGYNVLLGLETLSGAEPLQNSLYHDLHTTAGVPNEWGWRLRVDEPTFEANRGFYDMMGLRYLLREPSAITPPPPSLRALGQADLEVLENDGAWPRAFFTDYVGTYRSVEEFCALMKAAKGKPFAATLGPETSAPASYAARHIVPATSYRLTANTMEFTVKAPGPGLIVLGETDEPGNFRATVNGAATNYVRVNHIFKGIPVPAAGEYRIRYEYWPALLTTALRMSALGLAFFLAGSAFLLWPAKKRVPSPEASSPRITPDALPER